MIKRLRVLTQNRPKLRKVLSKIYGIFFEPFITGWFQYMVKYYITIYAGEIKELKKNGFSSIHPYLTKSWRRGNELDKAHRRYYIAEYNNEKVFVKVAVNDSTIENEIFMAKNMNDLGWKFIIPTCLTLKNFSGNMKLLAIKYIHDLHPFTINNNQDEFEEYCKEYIEILEKFESIRLIHADIHPKNLMLDSKNHLIVLDFGISSIIGKENKVDYIARPGTYYIQEENHRIYDDAYSYVKMVEDMNISDKLLNCKPYGYIKEKIGRNIIRIQLENNKEVKKRELQEKII